MGKRELLIIGGFVIVAAFAYHVTAPAPKAGERGFSFSNVFSNIKREISANAASAEIKKTGTIALSGSVTELRVSTIKSAPLTVIGEARQDIAYELGVDSTGPDEATAKGWADRVEIRKDDLGAALVLTLYFPEEGTQHASVTLKVPARLAVRVENTGTLQISGVSLADLRNSSADVTLSDVQAITGSHRNGDLTVNGAHTVDVTLSSSRAKLKNVTQSITINARNGECWIAESTGPVIATVANVDLTINSGKNTIKIGGEGGETKVLTAHQLSIDARRMRVDVEAAPAAGDLTIITSDEPLRVSFAADPSVTLDAVSKTGAIRAADFKLEPTTEGRDARLQATLGKGGARVVLRNSRGDIVIGQRK